MSSIIDTKSHIQYMSLATEKNRSLKQNMQRYLAYIQLDNNHIKFNTNHKWAKAFLHLFNTYHQNESL